MKSPTLLFLIAAAFSTNPTHAQDLKPLMVVPGEIAVENDFSKTTPLKKGIWSQRQHTRWEIKDGVLFGQPSSAEFQATATHHRGLEPRISVPATPAEFAASFSITFKGGEETPICPFVEFGHHVCRLKFSETDGLKLIADGETIVLAAEPKFKFKRDLKYTALAEMKGGEFVIQFADGPTLYAKHQSFVKPPSSGGNGLGVAGTKGGTIEIDDLKIWNVKTDSIQPGWEKRRAKFPEFKPTPTGKVKKPKKPAAK